MTKMSLGSFTSVNWLVIPRLWSSKNFQKRHGDKIEIHTCIERDAKRQIVDRYRDEIYSSSNYSMEDTRRKYSNCYREKKK